MAVSAAIALLPGERRRLGGSQSEPLVPWGAGTGGMHEAEPCVAVGAPARCRVKQPMTLTKAGPRAAPASG
jgi:hypothetical protein